MMRIIATFIYRHYELAAFAIEIFMNICIYAAAIRAITLLIRRWLASHIIHAVADFAMKLRIYVSRAAISCH